MKKIFLFVLLCALGLSANLALAQEYDDLYYDPATDGGTTIIVNGDAYFNYNDEDDPAYGAYEDEVYGYTEDDYYDFYYTSRIRRFHRPFYGFSYFDPCYVDVYYYDPFFSPGITIMIYDDYWSYRSWRRWNRWHHSWGWNSWGWNSWGWGGGPYISYNYYYFGNPGWNNWGCNSWGWNGWGWNTWGSSFYYPPTWGNGDVYVTNNTYYGARRKGSSKEPRPPVRRNQVQEDPVRGGSSIVPANTAERRRTEPTERQNGEREATRPTAPDERSRITNPGRVERTREENPRVNTRPNTRTNPDRSGREQARPPQPTRERPANMRPGNDRRTPGTRPNRSGSSRSGGSKARSGRGNDNRSSGSYRSSSGRSSRSSGSYRSSGRSSRSSGSYRSGGSRSSSRSSGSMRSGSSRSSGSSTRSSSSGRSSRRHH